MPLRVGCLKPLRQPAAIIVGAGILLKATPMTDVTRILSAIEQGDPHAAEQLLPLVYEELRKLAAAKMAQEKPGQTLQATALVHEAYIRLVDVEKAQHWDSRGHFFAAAAEAMRRILVNNALRKRCPKHGGDRQRVDLGANLALSRSSDDEILALNEALAKLDAVDKNSAEVVKLKYFAGLSIPQIAALLGISPRTADRPLGVRAGLASPRTVRGMRESRILLEFFGVIRYENLNCLLELIFHEGTGYGRTRDLRPGVGSD